MSRPSFCSHSGVRQYRCVPTHSFLLHKNPTYSPYGHNHSRAMPTSCPMQPPPIATLPPATTMPAAILPPGASVGLCCGQRKHHQQVHNRERKYTLTPGGQQDSWRLPAPPAGRCTQQQRSRCPIEFSPTDRIWGWPLATDTQKHRALDGRSAFDTDVQSDSAS